MTRKERPHFIELIADEGKWLYDSDNLYVTRILIPEGNPTTGEKWNEVTDEYRRQHEVTAEEPEKETLE